eukprot:382848_1
MTSKQTFKRIRATTSTQNTVRAILNDCNLEQYYDYLCNNGFTSIQALQLLNESDIERLPKIPYGHLKIIIQTTHKYAAQHSVVTKKYKQYITLLEQVPHPNALFSNMDAAITKYQQIKQQYLEQYSKYHTLHSKVSNAMKTPLFSESAVFSIIEDVQLFLFEVKALEQSFHQLRNHATHPKDTYGGTNTPIMLSNPHDNQLDRILATYEDSSMAHASFKYTKVPVEDDEQKVINETKHDISREFEGSTHYYLIYAQDPDNNDEQSITLAVLGVVVLAVQCVVNYVIIETGYEELARDQVPVTIHFNDCGYNDDARLNLDDFRCEIRDNSIGFLALAMILVSVFLQYDYFASIKVILTERRIWCKFAALLILLETMVTTWACCLYAYQGWWSHQGYDVIMNTVGILFIHDLDEKLFEAGSVIKMEEIRLFTDPQQFGMCNMLSKYWICRRCGWCVKRNFKMLLSTIFTFTMVCLGTWWFSTHFLIIAEEGDAEYGG